MKSLPKFLLKPLFSVGVDKTYIRIRKLLSNLSSLHDRRLLSLKQDDKLKV